MKTPTVRYRKMPGVPGVPGVQYWFDVIEPDGTSRFVGTVRKVSDATWSRSAYWRASDAQSEKVSGGSTRSQAVQELLAKMARPS